MTHPEHYIEDLLKCAAKSPCARDKRGALVVRNGEIRGRGWNSPATGACSDALCHQQQLAWVGAERPLKRVRSCSRVVEHAEAMAIWDAEQNLFADVLTDQVAYAAMHEFRGTCSLPGDRIPILYGCELIHLNTAADVENLSAPTGMQARGFNVTRVAKPSRRRGCPSCAVQAMTRGIAAVWLLHDTGWTRYTMQGYYDMAVA